MSLTVTVLALDAPPAPVLYAAADLLHTYGVHPAFWRHGAFVREYWPDDRVQLWRPGLPLSPLGAIGAAIGLRRAWDVTDHVIGCTVDDAQPCHGAVVALWEQIGGDSLPDLLRWIDHAGGLHIAATMRDTAAGLAENEVTS